MSLDAHQAAELAALETMQRGVTPLNEWIAQVSPRLPPPPHLRRITRLFERSRHEEVRAIVSIPPRHGKTTTFTHGLAWRVALDPACRNFYVSHGDTLALKTSRAVRRLVRRVGTPLSTEQQAIEDWATALGGGLKATTLQGQITGHGCNGGVIVCDDLIKGRRMAESKLQRDQAWDALRDDIMSRLEAGASLIVCQTRWHDDDPIGRLLRDPLGEDWEVIVMPAVANAAGEAIDERREPGACALWPEQFPLDKLSKARARGEYGWWSLYQQMPRPKGVQLFGEPSRFDLPGFVWEGCRGVIAVDPAATAKTHADHSAAVVAAMRGYGETSQMYVLEVLRLQVAIPELVRQLRALQRRYGLLIAVEAVAGFKAIPQMLRDQDPTLRVIEIQPKGDKHTRALPCSAAWQASRVNVPRAGAWVVPYVTEMGMFTGLEDAEDDQVDATVHAWNTLYRERPSRAGYGSSEQPDF